MAVTNQQSETQRNRVLRRADWRFLLSDPVPAKSICFASGLLATAVETISESVIADVDVVGGECSLAVAVNPDRVTLQRAWTALRPSGTCYTEWYSPTVGGVSGVRKRLELAGFENIQCYWAWPWPSRRPASFWVPLDAPTAAAFFVSSRPTSGSSKQRFVVQALRVLWSWAYRIGWLFPVCAIASKRSNRNSFAATTTNTGTLVPPPMTEAQCTDLNTHIRNVRNSRGERALVHKLRWLLLTGGQRSVNKVTGIVFADTEAHPRLAVKMSRVSESVPALQREASVLQSLEASRPGGIEGIPKVLFIDERERSCAVGETYLTGIPMYAFLNESTYRSLSLTGTQWLAGLAGKSPSTPAPSHAIGSANSLLAEFENFYGSVAHPVLIKETRKLLSHMVPLPVVYEHRDFSPWNVHLDSSQKPVVLDWESAELNGIPALDLIYFLTYLTFFLKGALPDRAREIYRETLDATTPTGKVIHECLNLYLKHLQIDPDLLVSLRVLTWLLHSRSEYERLVADTRGKPAREMLSKSLFFGLWEEDIIHYLNRH